MTTPSRTINPIKAKLIEALEAAKEQLGLKTIKADISPNDIVEAIKQDIAYFPGIIITYAGRVPTRVGTTMQTDPTYAIFLADRSVSGPYVSGARAIDLIEDLVEFIDGKRFATEQKDFFEFAGDQLMFQDASMVIYQLLFRTTTFHQRRF